MPDRPADPRIVLGDTTEPRPHRFPGLDVVAIVPCHNEETAVASVVRDLRTAVPGIRIVVYDNRSTDRTGEVALAAGAELRHEGRKGKGNVVRRAFADLDADVYVLIDGDDTYDASATGLLIDTLLTGPYDHVLGVRNDTQENGSSYRSGHAAGNKAFNRLTSTVFGESVTDMLSGFRVFSRRFVKSFPADSREFEIETELTVHAVHLRVPQIEVPVGFKDRPEGSESKLRTYRDGSKILGLLVTLLRHERPIAFFGIVSAVIIALAAILLVPILLTFADTGLVPRFPTLFLVFTLVMLAVLLFVAGVILDGIRRSRRELARLHYLRMPSVPLRTAPLGDAA